MDNTTTSSCGSLGEALRSARDRAGLTRAQLAMLAGCSLATLGNLEAGAIPRRSAALERVREALASAERNSRGESATTQDDRQACTPDGRSTAEGSGRHEGQ